MELAKPHILCVDDHFDTRALLSLMFEQAGFEVSTAATVSEGLSLAESESFDIFVLDNRFADGSGIELCQHIREFDAFTPVIFFSGLAFESDRTRAFEAGAQAYLVKPTDLNELVLVSEELARSRATMPCPPEFALRGTWRRGA